MQGEHTRTHTFQQAHKGEHDGGRGGRESEEPAVLQEALPSGSRSSELKADDETTDELSADGLLQHHFTLLQHLYTYFTCFLVLSSLIVRKYKYLGHPRPPHTIKAFPCSSGFEPSAPLSFEADQFCFAPSGTCQKCASIYCVVIFLLLIF